MQDILWKWLKDNERSNKSIVNFLDICLTCRAANTIHTQMKVTSHCTCTRNPTIHHLSWKTSQIPSTNGFQKYHWTENALTIPKPCTKKPSMKAVTIITCLTMCHATRGSSHRRTVQETFFGIIHLSGTECSKWNIPSGNSVQIAEELARYIHFMPCAYIYFIIWPNYDLQHSNLK